MAASIASNLDTSEWEVINDDGFVYKRKKRRIDPTSLIRVPDPDADPAVELKQRRKRKRQALLKLKDKYLREISLWDNLSNTLKSIQDSVNSKENQFREKDAQERERGNVLETSSKRFESVGAVEKCNGSLVDDLLLQVEAQEAIIRNFEQLCDVVDSLCNAQEEKTNQQFFNLPVWNSPRELMASLCEE